MIWSTRVPADEAGDGPRTTSWPVHEVGRRTRHLRRRPQAGCCGPAPPSSRTRFTSTRTDGTPAPTSKSASASTRRDYTPKYRRAFFGLGNGSDIDIRAGEAGQELHAYQVLNQHTKIVTFEPHLHAPGMRMCLEAIWGFNVETINCVGYDHNWVRGYTYAQDHQPLLPEGHHPAHRRLHGHLRRQSQRAGHAQLAGFGQPLGRQHVHRSRHAGSRSPTSSSSRRWRSAANASRSAPTTTWSDARSAMVVPANGNPRYYADDGGGGGQDDQTGNSTDATPSPWESLAAWMGG